MILGIIAVIIFLSILILVHELGHFLVAKKFGLLVEEFGFGLPPRIWGRKIGETVYSLNALLFGGFVKIFGDGEVVEKPRSFPSLSLGRRAVIIAAGVLMNFLFGWLALSAVFSIGLPTAVVITETREKSPAMEIGLKPGDAIISAGADSIYLNGDKLNVENFIKLIDERRGKEVSLKIQRNGDTLEFNVTPRISPPIGEGALGIGLIDAGLPKKNIIISLWEGFKESIGLIKTIIVSIFGLIAKAFIGKASFEQVTGPIGIVKIASQAGTLGFVYLLQLLALISLNLAIINILPFPALDGGRLIFLAIEKIKGSPLNNKFEKITNAVGFALLIFLMLIITIKDIVKF
ncbi:RIP metalloprotease RseP [Candidatus Wolfebacteria bacterium]|nr:RIP metalloprotease RseP [Candidatus Wolfebacteria bacterium]